MTRATIADFKPLKKRVKYLLIGGILAVVMRLSTVLPRRLWLSICGVLGRLALRFAGKMRNQVRTHLNFAFGSEKTREQIDLLTKRTFIMLAKNAGLVMRSFHSTASEFRKQSITSGLEHAESAIKKGRGVIFLTAHIGPFECIATDLALRGFKPLIIGTTLKNPKINSMLIQNRTRFGAVAIDRGKDTYRLMKNLKRGGTMAILIDQDTNVKSVFVNFFGKPCATPIGASLLAIRTGAAIIPVFTHLNKDGTQHIDYYPEVILEETGDEDKDVVSITQTLTTIIENEVRKFPEQWVWMHRRWKTQPEP